MRTALTDLVGVRHPIVQTGLGYVSGAGLTAATAAAGGLGIIGSATMSLDELRTAVRTVKERTDAPFGVPLRRAFAARATLRLCRSQQPVQQVEGVVRVALGDHDPGGGKVL